MHTRIALTLATPVVALLAALGPLAVAPPVAAAHSTSSASATHSPAEHRSAEAKALALGARFYRPFVTGEAPDPRILAKNWVDRPLAAGQAPGRAGLGPVIGYFRSVFPDLRVKITAEHVSDDGHTVTVRTVFSGTQRAAFLGVPATGARISFRTTDVHRIAGGRIVETWHLEDTFGAYQQMLAAQH